MRQKYATRLTKEELVNAGITEITKEGRVFRGEKEVNLSVNSQGYLTLAIYKLDKEGNKIKKPITRRMPGCKRDTDTYIYELRSIGLHRAMWAWHFGVVEEGYVVDHISNRHTELEDYRLENLQVLTQAENLEKERGESTRMLKCKLNKPLSFYEEKLNKYTAEYNKAKLEHNAIDCHKLRTNVANAKARIRYYLAHKEEADKLLQEKEKQQIKEKKTPKVYIKNEHYHEVAKMKNELTKASKEMRWEQGKEIRKFIRLYEDKRDYEILVKLYKAIVEEK